MGFSYAREQREAAIARLAIPSYNTDRSKNEPILVDRNEENYVLILM